MATAVSNLGKWDGWFDAEPRPLAKSESYELGAQWLVDCDLVEDWGCGAGWLSKFVPADRYRGIDGSSTPFATSIVDLETYRSSVPGIFMRHVLEHNPRWQLVLGNALDSFTERMVLVLFTPLGKVTRDLEFEDPPGVPNLSFCVDDLTQPMNDRGIDWKVTELDTKVRFGARKRKGVETMFFLQKGHGE